MQERWLFRKDTYSGGRRNLRSGREVNTLSYNGVIYPHVLPRFIDISVCFQYVPRHCWGIESELDNLLEVILNLTEQASSKEHFQPTLFSSNSASLSLEICKIMCSCPNHYHDDVLLTTMNNFGIIAALKKLQKHRKVSAINSKTVCYTDTISVEQINMAINMAIRE